MPIGVVNVIPNSLGELRRPADRPVFEERVAVARQAAEAGDPTVLQGVQRALLLHLHAGK